MGKINNATNLITQRLVLRQWRDQDRKPFAQINADPQVMRYFPSPLDAAASDALLLRNRHNIEVRGWGLWAVERRVDGAFIGFVGLEQPMAALPCAPCAEVGWRLGVAFWGNGYATEAAKASLQYGFGELALDEIVSFTTLANQPSRAVMQRLGMVNADEDFDHPNLPAGHELRRHCLYRLSRRQWSERTQV